MSTKEEVFNYVMNTPGNTNPAVLKSLLDGVEYTKPEGVALPSFSFIDNTNDGFAVSYFCLGNYNTLISMDGNNPYIATNIEDYEVSYYLPRLQNNQYTFGGRIDTQSDIYTVTINGSPVAFNDSAYFINISADTPIDINIVVVDKTSGK